MNQWHVEHLVWRGGTDEEPIGEWVTYPGATGIWETLWNERLIPWPTGMPANPRHDRTLKYLAKLSKNAKSLQLAMLVATHSLRAFPQSRPLRLHNRRTRQVIVLP